MMGTVDAVCEQARAVVTENDKSTRLTDTILTCGFQSDGQGKGLRMLPGYLRATLFGKRGLYLEKSESADNNRPTTT